MQQQRGFATPGSECFMGAMKISATLLRLLAPRAISLNSNRRAAALKRPPIPLFLLLSRRAFLIGAPPRDERQLASLK